MSRFAALLLLTAVPAFAEPLTGTIADPSLKRKVDLVYIEHVDGDFKPTGQQPVMNQRGNTYRPHVLPVLAGSKVLFQSEDKELHNVFARAVKRVLFNDAVLPGGRFERSFTQPGVVHLTCNIHKEMSAYVLVLQNPYFTTIDRQTGAFTIANVPPGTYTVRIWGEALSDEQNARGFKVTVGTSSEPLRVAALEGGIR